MSIRVMVSLVRKTNGRTQILGMMKSCNELFDKTIGLTEIKFIIIIILRGLGIKRGIIIYLFFAFLHMRFRSN